MKKVLLTLTLAAFAFAANAQFVVGGSLGFSTTGGHTNYVGDGDKYPDWTIPASTNSYEKTTSFSIAPKFGYQLNDNMQVGISLGYSYYIQKDFSPNYTSYSFPSLYRTYSDFEGWQTITKQKFFFAPYFRYNLGHIGNFTLFCELEAMVTISPRLKYHQFNTKVVDDGVELLPATDTTFMSDVKTLAFNLSVTPGLNYKINDRLSADLYIDLLGLHYTYTKETNYNWNFDDDKDYRVIVDSQFGLNADLTAHSLDSHLGYFRLGFNYHF